MKTNIFAALSCRMWFILALNLTATFCKDPGDLAMVGYRGVVEGRPPESIFHVRVSSSSQEQFDQRNIANLI